VSRCCCRGSVAIAGADCACVGRHGRQHGSGAVARTQHVASALAGARHHTVSPQLKTPSTLRTSKASSHHDVAPPLLRCSVSGRT
jgi:hypothetical protein